MHLWWYSCCCWSKKLDLGELNRYVFKIRSRAAHTANKKHFHVRWKIPLFYTNGNRMKITVDDIFLNGFTRIRWTMAMNAIKLVNHSLHFVLECFFKCELFANWPNSDTTNSQCVKYFFTHIWWIMKKKRIYIYR